MELFEQVDGPSAKTALARLSQLVEKADRSMTVFRNSLQQEDNANTRRPQASAEGISVEVDAALRREGDSGMMSRYPESNVRNAADLLGASTKLVREVRSLFPSIAIKRSCYFGHRNTRIRLETLLRSQNIHGSHLQHHNHGVRVTPK